MARANRLSGHGGIFHVTHRCHNREFLLKFACDRDGYRAKLRQRLREFEVALLDYCLCYIELNMERCGRVAHPRE